MVVGDFVVELNTVVIGVGSGGYVATIHAAEMGRKVAIIEREYIGGVCLNVGCIPLKALIAAGHHYQEPLDSEMSGVASENVKLDSTKTQEWKENKVVHTLTSSVGLLLKKHKVETIRGEASFVDDHTLCVIHLDSAQAYSLNNAIVATGSRPIEVPGFKFGGRVLDSTGRLGLKEVPKKFAIIGDNVTDAELGGTYANSEAEVTIPEGLPQILPAYKKGLVRLVEDDLREKDIIVVTNAMVKETVNNGNSMIVKCAVDGKEEPATADYTVVAVGHCPNTDDMGLKQAGIEIGERGLIAIGRQGRTNVPSIHAIGDIVPEVALTHKVSYETRIVTEAASSKKVAVDYKATPAVASTDSELASVGMTIKEAKDASIEAEAYKFPFSGNGRALSLGRTEGFVHLVTTIENNVLISTQTGGVDASDMVSELVLVIESGMNAEDIALTIHPYPPLGEVVMGASELALGLPIHA